MAREHPNHQAREKSKLFIWKLISVWELIYTINKEGALQAAEVTGLLPQLFQPGIPRGGSQEQRGCCITAVPG